MIFTVLVRISVKPGSLEEFVAGLRSNAEESLREEPGCLRFDVHQLDGHPYEFLLHEVYRDQNAYFVEHRAAPHHAIWRDVVARCVVEGSQVIAFAGPDSNT